MKKVRVGVIGLGQRGKGLLLTMLVCEACEIVALCDVYPDRMEDCERIVTEHYGTRPALYPSYKDLLRDENVDAVVIATSWETHTRIAVAAMRAGKYTALEVAGAGDLEDCWQLVRTYEETETPIMLLENCCFDRFELLATSLARAGRLGKVLYCHGAYAHELRGEILGGHVNRHYRLENYMYRNCENYPTHELGPIAKLLNINRGNKMLTLTSVATKGGVGLAEFSASDRNPDPSLQGTPFAQGDIVVTTITCAGGEVITLRLDTTLPRPYAREFTVRGTKGYCSQDTNMVMLESDKNMHEFFDMSRTVRKYLGCAEEYTEYLPDIWRNITPEEKKLGHGGMDYLELKAFFDAIINGEEMPIDVYDMATWMAITPLSEQSVAQGGMPQAIPDFTRGEWILRKPKDVVPMPKVESENNESKTDFGYSRK
ncbi:MAG: Gfo/Idh/MocA family oxidoreductase [Clostridia bacterium]|nr:Gfo/Idh/MocA family oxidoreductase [Clostridia bacterium]